MNRWAVAWHHRRHRPGAQGPVLRRLFTRLLSDPGCPACGGALQLVREQQVESIQPVFELTFDCSRCGERTRRVKVCELFD